MGRYLQLIAGTAWLSACNPSPPPIGPTTASNEIEIEIVSTPAPTSQPSCGATVYFCDREWPATTQKIDCFNESVTDLEPVRCLPQLTHLNLEDAQVEDLSPLADLTLLHTLILEGNPVRDLSPLSGLKQLASLDLSHTQVKDLSPLSGSTSLTHLGLRFTPVDDLAPLDGLTQLEYLDLTRTAVDRDEVRAFAKARPNLSLD